MSLLAGGEAAFLAFAVAAIDWIRRHFIVELVKPIKLGPIVIRWRPRATPHGSTNISDR